jgi:MFS transporter, DHA1 family, tetracycline resistance protein
LNFKNQLFYKIKNKMSEKRNAGLTFIFITLLIDVTGFGIIIPILPQLISELVSGDLSTASRWGGLLMFIFAIMQFICAPIMGGLSDMYGRRPVLLATLFAFGLDFILQGLAPSIWWLFIGRMIAGITGASFSTAGAYIADVSEPEKRAQNFGIIGAAFGVGFILGPVIGGFLGQYGSRVPFFAAAALALINFTYGYFILPESLKPENRRPFDWTRANPLGTLLRVRRYPVLLSLLGALSFMYIAGHANQSTWSYIMMDKFGWDARMVGISLGWVGLTVGIVQGGLTRIIIPKLGQIKSVYVGLILSAIGFLLFAFADQSWMVFVFMIPFALGGIAGPALQGIMSNQVPPDEQGELQGTLSSVMSLTSIIGPLLMSNLFSHFTRPGATLHFAGAPFLAGSILAIISAFLAWRTLSNNASVPPQ